jgi:hypothetical protein
VGTAYTTETAKGCVCVMCVPAGTGAITAPTGMGMHNPSWTMVKAEGNVIGTSGSDTQIGRGKAN